MRCDCELFFIDKGDLDNMIVTIARYFYFSPQTINRLYLDSIDHLGIEFWYNDAEIQHKETDKYLKKNG